MATIANANNSSYPNTSRLSYIACNPFSNNIYTYTTNVNNFVTRGTLTSFAAGGIANDSVCVAGHVLRENGRKLYPDANPNVTTYMVGVYDSQTMLSGFIDPNAPQFAVYNTDKPNFFKDGVNPATGLTDHGAPVCTDGSVAAGTTVTAGTFVYAGSGIGYTTGSGGAVTQGTSKITGVTLNKPTGNITMFTATSIASGATVSFTLTNSFIDPNDIVVLNTPWISYTIAAYVTADNTCQIYVRNNSGGPLAEAVTIQFAVIKGAIA